MLVIHSLATERSIKVSSTGRIKWNSFSVPRDCTGTEQPCWAWWWAPTSAHNCHARTHSFWGMECNQGITWWAHHSHHQEEESQLCYQQVIQNFVRGGIRLLPIFKQRILLLAGTWLAQQDTQTAPVRSTLDLTASYRESCLGLTEMISNFRNRCYKAYNYKIMTLLIIYQL